MPVTIKNCYAFDECSILNTCKIVIPGAFVYLFKQKEFFSKNHYKLNKLISALESNEIPKYKFFPGNFDAHILERVEEILAERGVNPLMFDNLRTGLIIQLEEFIQAINTSYQNINKSDDITLIRKIFHDNEKKLKRGSNIPEDDDCKILAGYQKIDCSGIKYLISADEHFWGYDDLIAKNCSINVVSERECDSLC